MHSIRAFDRHDGEPITKINKFPDACPSCRRGIQPITKEAYLDGEGLNSTWLQLVCRCPREECGLTFLSFYKGAGEFNRKEFFYKYSAPGMPQPPSIQETIKKVSPSFCSIYAQSAAAESYGLLEICGAGYRKALEFLIKDYLISMGSDKNEIEKMLLGACIGKYIDDPNVKQVAKRAAWLGNDETHYYRKWIDKDLEDLKKLLHLVQNAIDSLITAKQYMEDMKE